MKPIWLVGHRDDGYDSSNTTRLVFLIQELGMEVHCKGYGEFLFGGADSLNYDFLPKDRPVIFQGSINMIQHGLHQGDRFYPCAWCDWKLLTCQSYYAHWGKYLVQRKYGFYPLAEVVRNPDMMFELYGKNGVIFVRPDANNKSFTGDCINRDRFEHWKYTVFCNDPPKESLCVVCRPEKILNEYRLIIADGKVIAGSQYRTEGGLEFDPYYPDDMVPLAEEIAQVWSPHPIYCLDMAQTPEGYRVMECGSVNAAGFYKADLRAIVTAMSDIAVREWNDVYS